MLRLVLADLAADYLFHVQGLESSSGFKSYSQGTWLQNRNCKEYIEALRTICLAANMHCSFTKLVMSEFTIQVRFESAAPSL